MQSLGLSTGLQATIACYCCILVTILLLCVGIPYADSSALMNLHTHPYWNRMRVFKLVQHRQQHALLHGALPLLPQDGLVITTQSCWFSLWLLLNRLNISLSTIFMDASFHDCFLLRQRAPAMKYRRHRHGNLLPAFFWSTTLSLGHCILQEVRLCGPATHLNDICPSTQCRTFCILLMSDVVFADRCLLG